MQLTAGYLHGACLPIQGVQLQVHGAGEGEGDPDAEEDHPVREYSDIQIRNQNIVHSAASLIAEKCVRHPHFSRLCYGEVLNLV